MMKIRLVATDLDGTLLRDDGSVSDRTRAALCAAADAGALVVLVTARPPRDVRHIAADVGAHGIGVCSNGAVIYDLARDVEISREVISAELAQKLADDLRAQDARFCFATEHGHKVGYEPSFPRVFDGFNHDHKPRTDHIDQLCAEAIVKLVVHHPEFEGDALAREVASTVRDRAAVTHSGATNFIEIGRHGVSKATGLRRVTDHLGIRPEAWIAFGDMPNDIPMLKLAGRGFAVSNAHPEVLAAASDVTASNEEDGVAVVLEALFRQDPSSRTA